MTVVIEYIHIIVANQIAKLLFISNTIQQNAKLFSEKSGVCIRRAINNSNNDISGCAKYRPINFNANALDIIIKIAQIVAFHKFYFLSNKQPNTNAGFGGTVFFKEFIGINTIQITYIISQPGFRETNDRKSKVKAVHISFKIR